MPRETIVVLSGIMLAFGIFALVLAWADAYTKKATPPGSNG
jgi:hypothetical protein